MVNVAVSSSTALAASDTAAGVPVASEDQSPSPVAFIAATRMLYCVPFVRLAIVWLVPVGVAWFVLPYSPSDFHCTL